ncbi:MAG: MBL fold metallo-hydrolase [Promethearchaeota archaeon]|nr:MAG: MBL fold metallo-hydrolase [Candidatus Lokiarchaeota archaeon]
MVKVVASNRTSMTISTDKKYKGKVIQPRHNSFGTFGEHGIAMIIRILEGDSSHLILFDTAGYMQTVIHNLIQFKIKFKEIEKLIISHGHLDHYGALIPIIPKMKGGSEVYISPISLAKGYFAKTKSGNDLSPNDFGTSFKILKKEGKLQFYSRTRRIDRDMVLNRANKNNVKLIETTVPEKLYEGIITSGEIEIFDDTEIPKGLYLGKSKIEYDKHTYREEIALYINIKDKGLVVITGCSHTGIKNIIKHGQKLTGVKKIYAIIGGFHKELESIENIDKIVSFIEELNPEITCGMHCTGFEFNRIMHRHPSHVIGVVGTEFHL